MRRQKTAVTLEEIAGRLISPQIAGCPLYKPACSILSASESYCCAISISCNRTCSLATILASRRMRAASSWECSLVFSTTQHRRLSRRKKP